MAQNDTDLELIEGLTDDQERLLLGAGAGFLLAGGTGALAGAFIAHVWDE